MVTSLRRRSETLNPALGFCVTVDGAKDVAFGPGETRRHDADDLIRNVIEADGATEDVRIAEEIALPETIAEDGDVGGVLSRRSVGRNEPAAEERGTPK